MSFIIGDLNINMSCPSDADDLKDVMDMHGLHDLVQEPTCFKGKTPSLIDLVLTCKRVVSTTINFDTGLSDFHNMVFFETKIHVALSQENVITYRSYKKVYDENFKHVENAPYHKNIERHTADTIVSCPNPKQWVIVHTSDLMMIIRQSIYIISIITRGMGKLKTQSPTYCIMNN